MTMASTTEEQVDPTRRHDFVLVFDATDSNPNGDPDAGNLPRTDPETGHGIVTDVSLKRKVRNYVATVESMLPESDPQRQRLNIYVEEGVALNERHRRALNAVGKEKSKGADPDARAWMCDHFFDVRMFGAVMSTKGLNCGQVLGPVQFSFARSVDPVFAHDISITRVAVTREDELTKLAASDDEGGKDREMGRKALIPYGLYVACGTYSPHRAMRNGRRSDGTGVDSVDLDLLWRALVNMWDLDVSAARGNMATRALHVFSHRNPLGDEPRHKVFDRVRVARKPEVAVPRRFTDYTVEVDVVELGPIAHRQLA